MRLVLSTRVLRMYKNGYCSLQGLQGRLPGEGYIEAEGLVMKNKEAASWGLRCGSIGKEAEGPKCNLQHYIKLSVLMGPGGTRL